MVTGSDDAAGKKDRSGQQRRRGRDPRSNQIQAHEDEGDDGGGKDLEEAFDPQVNHPPTPVFDDRQ
jgi:hypothetical protein